ncbi:hypothetical protein TrCOL_g13677 [Triparma columacea]|uniref:PPPDE domain-containing protein n=1 Tax=Triparma columacea TaxID=722753 RepID=A0A9W7LAH3_9STRA|nr:hypothetical protein TrCOL_g13677 [Triparma columacea]
MQSLLGSNVVLHMLVSTVLPSIGLGAYHTSVDVGGYNYQYGAGVGICRGKLVGGGGRHEDNLPAGCSYFKSLPLGSCKLDDQGELNSLINTLRSTTFPDAGYNVVTRNCNHFTTVLSTAVCCADVIMQGSDSGNDFKGLSTYPLWVNRLARSGGAVGAGGVKGTGAEGGGCEDEVREARDAVGKGKVKWSLPQRDEKKSWKKAGEKKVLTEKQKALLAKMKKNNE